MRLFHQLPDILALSFKCWFYHISHAPQGGKTSGGHVESPLLVAFSISKR